MLIALLIIVVVTGVFLWKKHKAAKQEELLRAERIAKIEKEMVEDEEGWAVLPVPIVKQTTPYNCCPASVKAVVHSLTGKSKSQNFYAKEMETDEMGTDWNMIPPVLEKHTGLSWQIASFSSKGQWQSMVYENIVEKGKPVIIDINSDTRFWRYNTNGHYLVIAGIKKAENGSREFTRVCLADSSTAYPRLYYKSMDSVYKANAQHYFRSMIR